MTGYEGIQFIDPARRCPDNDPDNECVEIACWRGHQFSDLPLGGLRLLPNLCRVRPAFLRPKIEVGQVQLIARRLEVTMIPSTL